MEMTIKSRKLNTEITFSTAGTQYIFADLNGKAGTLGKQICRAGKLTGSTVTCNGDDQREFENICRGWYRAYVALLV